MLKLRPYKPCDAKEIVTWIEDEKVFWWWSAGRYPSYPLTEKDMHNYGAALEHNENMWAMTAIDEDGIAGYLMIEFLDERKEHLKFGCIVINPKRRGQGYGTKFLKLALSYAFEILGVESVCLGVYEDNEPAYQCYKKLGFSEVVGEGWEAPYFDGVQKVKKMCIEKSKI